MSDEAALLRRAARDKVLARTLGPTPDTGYRPVARAPAALPKRPGGDRHRPLRPVRRADPGGDGLPADHPRTRQGRAGAHQGHLGRCGAAVGPDARKQRAVRRGRRRHLLRRQALVGDQGPAASRPQGAGGIRRAPARRRRSSGSPSRISAPSAWCRWSKPCAPRSRRWAASTASAPRWSDFVIETGRDGQRRLRGVVTESGETIETEHVRAGDRPFRARHLRDAAGARRVRGGEAVLDRRADRASAVGDRPRPLRRLRRQPDPGRGRLQAGAPLHGPGPTAAPSTPSACARAAPWSRRPARRAAWSPMA